MNRATTFLLISVGLVMLWGCKKSVEPTKSANLESTRSEDGASEISGRDLKNVHSSSSNQSSPTKWSEPKASEPKASEPKKKSEPKSGEPNTQETKSTGTTTNSKKIVVSKVLKQAMLVASVEIMKKQNPNIKQADVLNRIDEAISQIRKVDPEFLRLSEDRESKLQSGQAIDGVGERIAAAESFFRTAGLRHSGLVDSLLAQHKTGKLSVIQTELLAQLFMADMKKAKAALTKSK